MFYLNFVRLCNSIGKSPSAVAEDMGLQRSSVTRWANGSAPRKATVEKIATYFGVDSKELTGEEQKEKPAPGEGSGLDAAFNAVLDQLTEQELADVLQYAKFKVASRKENSNG
ncbi:MAG: helix-turn-helix domain-containing protein [Faecalibacterium prausnitzii]